MLPVWLRNPITAFYLGVLSVGLSVVVLLAVNGDSKTESNQGENALVEVASPTADSRSVFDEIVPPEGAMASSRRGATIGRGVAVALAETSSRDESLGRVVVVTGPAFGQQTILWTEAGAGRSETLTASGDVVFETLLGGDSVVMYAVLQRTSEGQRELGIVYDATAFGSGSPTARYALLRLEDDEWKVLWDSGIDEKWRGSHGTVEFVQRDLSELIVRSDSWVDAHDELSAVVHESNPGPHRYFVDRWVREGDEYVRESSETIATPYATFVAFLYALGTGDEPAAEERVENRELLAVARDYGLDAALEHHWLTTCESGLVCGKEGPIRFDALQYHGEPAVAVYFEERDGEWLISDIQSSKGS